MLLPSENKLYLLNPVHTLKIKQKSSKKHSLISTATSGLARTPEAPRVVGSLSLMAGTLKRIN